MDRDLSGTLLAGRYRVLSQIGGGGMGTVHAGEHLEVGRKVAIKILRQEAVGHPTLVERFRREARLTARIEHEHVVECLDVGVSDEGLCFYVMEWLRGEDLQALLRREGTLSWPRARAIVAQVCRALAAAHERGIIHRDLKPGNIFLIAREGNRDFVKVLDFGIAKLVADQEAPGDVLTRTGQVVGTTPYMAPELAAGEPIDHRIDIYATGVILFQCLAGRLPYRGKTPRQILADILKGDTPRLAEINPRISASPELDALLQRALHREASERFPDMAALHDALLDLPETACGPVEADAPAIAASASESSMARSMLGPMSAGDRGQGRSVASDPLAARPDDELTVVEDHVTIVRPRRPGRLAVALSALLVMAGSAVWLAWVNGLLSAPATQEAAHEPVSDAQVTTPRQPAPTPADAAPPQPAPTPADAAPVVEAGQEPTSEAGDEPAAAGETGAGEAKGKPRVEARSDFDDVMRRASVRVRRCLVQRGVKAGTRLRFDVVVEARTGRITGASTRGAQDGQEHGSCVVAGALGLTVRPAPANEWHRSYELTT